MRYPKRLIEVDLPIKRISAHARREKSIRHGHISTLHIWWARRPLAACRAVVCASLWPDPGDPLCPPRFTAAARRLMLFWAKEGSGDSSPDSFPRLNRINNAPATLDDPCELRTTLLDFIADFANWDNSTNERYIAVARALTVAAHYALEGLDTFKLPKRLSVEALGQAMRDAPRPMLVDPFAGGGAIPLEALRCGADAFASDLNPVAVLLNKVVLEYIPKYGQRLADEVRKWGQWIKVEAEKELAEFYPKDPDGATPIAYLWARTIQCEGPGCGAEVPLIRSVWLAKKANRSVALQLVPQPTAKRVDFKIIVKQHGGWVNQGDLKERITKPEFAGTVKRGSATCPCCGYTTPVARVREQLKARRGGANDARLMCVVTVCPAKQGRCYRLPCKTDSVPLEGSTAKLQQITSAHRGPIGLLPDEKLDLRGIRHTWGMIYGQETWRDHFSARQLLALVTFTRLIQEVARSGHGDLGLHRAVASCLALNLGKLADLANSLCPWEPVAECPRHLFSRQAVPFTWDSGEGVPIGESSGSWHVMAERFADILATIGSNWAESTPQQASATAHPLPDDSAQAYFTDPPYYDAVPYAYLSDFFYVWLRRSLAAVHPGLFKEEVVPKDEEIVVDRMHELSNSTHDIAFYERELTKAFAEGRRVLRPDGVGTIVFASKSTASWEAILKAVVDAGWVITGSWPIDTEMETRVAAQGQARLASSVHLVCRPREDESGKATDSVGDWRDVLAELPVRIADWLPRLASEGVVGADAIFACLGPALEIFSRYSSVEKASGEKVELRVYLEQVWAEVARQALNMIFEGADASGFEEDARLTAMWLWTLRTDPVDGDGSADGGDDEDAEEGGDDEESAGTRSAKAQRLPGYVLEYDAARKIAQGLGCHLEALGNLVEVKGDKATLLSAASRAPHLFGRDDIAVSSQPRKRKADAQQLDLFQQLGMTSDAEAEKQQAEFERPPSGETVLDQLHQSMLLFSGGRGNALARFLVEDGVGRNAQFWVLAQALSALYPPSTDEKRWVDGVLARKKGMGF
jgi:adenine-specific DNA methylase